MRQQERDFHLKTYSDEKDEKGALHAYVAELRSLGWRTVEEKFGTETVAKVVERLKTEPEMRLNMIGELRKAWWIARNHKGGNYARDEAQRAREKGKMTSLGWAIHVIVEATEFFTLAGFRGSDIRALHDCLGHACTCNGCDLANGKRFESAEAVKVQRRIVRLNGGRTAARGKKP